MKTLRDYSFKGTTVLVRCDFNVPIKDGVVLDTFRIERALETINYLIKQRAKIILMSHMGDEKQSLGIIIDILSNYLGVNVKFSGKIFESRFKKTLEEGEVLLLENIRMDKGEKNKDIEFVNKIVGGVDYYVNEAFSVCHRDHASMTLIPQIIPTCAGFNLEEEIRVLTNLMNEPQRPFSVMIGGIKLESKLKIAEKFSKKADHLLLGGRVADVVMRVKGFSIGRPWPAEEYVEMINNIDITKNNIHLPVDALVSLDREGSEYVRECALGSVRKEEESYDIGCETIRKFSHIISESRTIFWAGTMGVYENEKFANGTRELGEIITRTKGLWSVVGGGDTVSALRKFNLADRFSFVSTGGGAMLEFVSGKELPGIKSLWRSS